MEPIGRRAIHRTSGADGPNPRGHHFPICTAEHGRAGKAILSLDWCIAKPSQNVVKLQKKKSDLARFTLSGADQNVTDALQVRNTRTVRHSRMEILLIDYDRSWKLFWT